jgi:DNA-binding transcriptional regulator YiaG
VNYVLTMSEPNARPMRIQQSVVQRGLGRRIVDLRRARGWKQGDLAKRLEVPSDRLGKWERGLNAPSLEDLTALAFVLEVTYLELIEGSQAPVRPLLPPGERVELGMCVNGFLRIVAPLMAGPNGKPGGQRGSKTCP